MPNRNFPKGFRMILAAGCLFSVAGAAVADSPITTTGQVDSHFEVASKDFGGGKVQLHSRKESETGTTHAVHNIDCVNKTYTPVYEDDNAPDAFPFDNLDFNLNPIDETSPVAPLAQHACKKHGYPLLEW
ncbi:hypothetical protein QO034_04645 [Sedimentitalea sp. JM2-8]|uniref:Uncharacterized protein n=1 Tax=Sedimentitalea xiamensis TaxID=3050037 RepID=A0ABT7FBH9_9RHOB|nr:hypothetical protein [Sedimentitalea xiamensis]MDK3072393.1 hypothetical protein [Sedimentitalea xiamensis]